MMRRPVARAGRPGVVGTMARTAVVAGTATAVAGSVSRHQQAKAQQAADAQAIETQQAMAAAQAQAAPSPAHTGPSQADLEQLAQLGNLHQQGILTDEEFAAQKARILGS